MFSSKDVFFGSQSTGGYTIAKSLRFRSSASAGFIKTTGYPTPTNTSKWTVSMWVKRGAIGFNYAGLFGHTISAAANFSMYFASDDKLYWNFNNTYGNVTTQVFRDPSAWYHFVFVWDSANATASNRARIYVNGAEITSYSTDTRANITTSMDCWNTTNTTYASGIGANTATASTITNFFDGYFAEVYNIDGQTLTPSDFGKTDPATGVWVPIQYTGTYGGAGFYFKFTDIAATSGSNVGYGKDFSPNGNYWNTQNFSTTSTGASAVSYDSMVDTPTNYDNGGNGAGNYATLNPLWNYSSTITGGNLDWTSATTYGQTVATWAVSSGKWYWEYVIGSPGFVVGIMDASKNPSAGFTGIRAYYSLNGNKYTDATAAAYGVSFTTGDVVGCALDMDSGTLTFYKNNSSQGTAFTGLTGPWYPGFIGCDTTTTRTASVNFGQRPFTYTPPTGFKALCTQNLPTPTIGATSSTLANKYFDINLYTGNTPSSQSIVNSGGFQPDMVWLKGRANAWNNIVYDALRGATHGLITNATNAEDTSTAGNDFSSFNPNGFSVGPVQNNSSTNGAGTIVAWQWKANGSGSSNTSGSITSTVSANVTAGFSVVTFTCPASGNFTVGHGLGVVPAMIIVKSRWTAGNNWCVVHKGMTNMAAYFQQLNTTIAQTNNTSIWANTAPTPTVFSMGTNVACSPSDTAVAYCFAEVAGYSKFGSYTGNGSADGPFVFVGFRPKYVLIKRTDSTGNWLIWDTTRSPYNLTDLPLYPNLTNTEGAEPTRCLDVLSNGFKLRGTGTDVNASGSTYIYAAFAESPFNYARAR